MNLLARVNTAICQEAPVKLGGLGRTVLEVVAGKGMLTMEAHFAFRALGWCLPCVDTEVSCQVLLQRALPASGARDAPLLLSICLSAESLPDPT